MSPVATLLARFKNLSMIIISIMMIITIVLIFNVPTLVESTNTDISTLVLTDASADNSGQFNDDNDID